LGHARASSRDMLEFSNHSNGMKAGIHLEN
jgi:hypothetical protein